MGPPTQFTLSNGEHGTEPGEQLMVTKKARKIRRRSAEVLNHNKGAKLLV